MTANQDRFKQAMNQGHSAAWDQQWDKAAEYYKQALAMSPDNPGVLTSLGLAYYEMEDYLEAQKYYQRAAQVSPNDPVPLEKAAQISEALGNLKGAVDYYFKAAEAFAKIVTSTRLSMPGLKSSNSSPSICWPTPVWPSFTNAWDANSPRSWK